MAIRSLVTVVDDDESVRESLPDLLRELGFSARTFSSAEEFLASDALASTDVLLLDVAMPVMSGPELQHELQRRQAAVPIVFITAQPDVAMCERLLARGAVGYLRKPFSEGELLTALTSAVRRRAPDEGTP